jgi:hypothetical protein
VQEIFDVQRAARHQLSAGPEGGGYAVELSYALPELVLG